MTAPPGDPSSASDPGSSGPPGDGWDDGRGGRRGGSGRRGSRAGGGRAGRGGRTGSRNPWAGENSRLPRWVLPVGAVALLLVVVLVVVVATRGGGGPSDSGTCVDELLADLPGTATGHVAVTDVVQARSAGYDDGSDLETAGDTTEETGTVPDGLTAEMRFRPLDSVEEFTGSTGVAPGDIACSVRTSRSTVLGGSFDPDEVEGTDLAGSGRLVATEERLALTRIDGDPRALVKAADPALGDDDEVTGTLESLRELGAYSAIVDWDLEAETVVAAGVGVAGTGDDDRQLVLAWRFTDEGAAKAGRRSIVDVVNAFARGSASIAVEDLRLDGAEVTAAVAVRKAPQLNDQWAAGAVLLGDDG